MATFRTILFGFLVFAGFCAIAVQSQISVSNIPTSIQNCYRNTTAYNRYKRQPMRIENLIAIIRKLEYKTNYNWDMRRLTRTIVKRFQFDGMEYHPDKTQEFAYSQFPLEGLKSKIIHDMIPAPDLAFPDGALDNDELCALHWMMSHSMNATMRDDEEPDRYGRAYKGELRAKRFAGDASDDDSDEDVIHFSAQNPDGTLRRVARAVDKRTTNRPVETGVVYTRWGSISAGRLLAGIAAGLEPQEKPVTYVPSSSGSFSPSGRDGSNNNPQNPGQYPIQNPNQNPGAPGNMWPPNTGSGRKRRQTYGSITFVNLKNVFAATLAGDIGQAAILNAPYPIEQISVPTGNWNDTICPREYILNALPYPGTDAHHDHDTWTYMTGAEIRGGVDGLVLGSRIRNWDRGTTGAGIRLSQILEMYYSEDGVAGDTSYRSCDRYQLFQGSQELGDLREQAKSFAYDFNLLAQKIPVSDESSAAFINLVEKTYQKMLSFGSSMSSTDGNCLRRPTPVSGNVETPDRDKYTKIKTNVYAVTDHSVTNIWELKQQQRFIAQLAFDIEVSPMGSRVGLVDGGSGIILVRPNDTDNAAILACRIIDQPQLLRNQDIVQSLNSIKSELVRLREMEERTDYNIAVGRSTVVLVFVQGAKLEENRRDDIRRVLEEFSNEHGDVHIVFTSSRYNLNDIEPFLWNTNGYDFIKIRGSQNLSDDTVDFAKEFAKRAHAKLYYPRCNERLYEQNNEHLEPHDIFVTPGSIQYYQISPDSFFSSVDFRLRFTSEFGKARICISREEKFPSSLNDADNGNVECKETSGSYEAPGGTRYDIEFGYVKPCKSKKRGGCKPIYLSITTTTTSPSSAAQTDCSTYGCETPDQLKVTWSHYGMRCGAIGILVSGTGSIMTAILSLLYFYKSL